MARISRRAVAGALVGAALAGFARSRYRRDIARARARIASGGRMADTASGPIEYAEAGSGQAVLIAHGAGGGFDQGMSLGRALADRFRVVAMSRFGYLGTPLPREPSAEAQADAHAALLDALGIERASIVGASAGAPSALQFALRHPDRIDKLVLLVPAAFVPRAGGAPSVISSALVELISDTVLRSDFLFWATMRLSRDTLVRSLLATPPERVRSATAAEQARVRDMLAQILPVSARRLGLIYDGQICSSLPRYALERIASPTLAISFRDDLFGTYDAAEYTCSQIPFARFLGYETGGHVWVGRQQEVVDEMKAFLAA